MREGTAFVPKRAPKPCPPKPPKVCAHCGASYIKGGYVYCSPACGLEAKRAYDQQYNRSRASSHYGRCLDCGTDVSPQRKKCDNCRGATLRAARRRRRRKDKARRRGVRHEPYTLAEIAARDRNRCGLCRRRVAMTKAVPHPKAPTIDHVLPIAAGGDDTRANVQLAHFQCNWMKRDGGSQQLALVG